jgi:cytoskeleton protein RodZ
MSAADDNTGQESRPTGIGPGERLQAARIQQGLSLDDVASRMHLSASILEAIEDNNFEEITAPIFVKGYLRHYARIVALDEDEMIQQYSEYYSEEDPPISSTSNMVPELSVADARIKWTTYLVILVLAALLAAWWWNKGQNDEPTISLDTQTSSSEQSDQAVAEPAVSEIEAASEIPETTESVPAATQQLTMEEPVQVEAEATEPAVAEPVESVEPVEMQQSEQVETSADEAAEAASEPAQPERNVPGLIAPAGSDKLRIRINADTWTVIEDTSGYLMVRSVFLGNGHGVEIEFNGEEVDFSTRIRDNNTARLKIGG